MACVVATMLVGTGFSASRFALGDGGAWLASGDGSLVHVNGASGEVDWRITGAAGEGDEIEIVQGPQGAYLVNRTTGEITFVDPASFATSGLADGAGDTVLLVGGGDTYEVTGGTVRWIDAETFEPLAEPLSYRSPLAGVVDRDATLFLGTGEGDVVRIVEGAERAHHEAAPAGHDLRVTLAGGRPGVVDVTDGVVIPVDPSSGRPGDGIDLGIDRRLQVQAPSDDGRRLWVVSGAQSRLVGADLRSRDVLDTRIPRSRRIGSPRVVGDRVFVPAFDRGSLLRFNARDGDFLDEVDIGVEPGTAFDSFVKDGFLFVNDARSDVAAVVDQRGTVTSVDLGAPAPGDDGQGYDALGALPPPVAGTPPQDEPPNPLPDLPTPSATDLVDPSGPLDTVLVPPTTIPQTTTTTISPADVPGAPSDVVATAGPEGSGVATVTWRAAADDGGSRITGYRVVSADGPFEDVDADIRSVEFTELELGRSVSFDVYAVNDVGRGTPARSNDVLPLDQNGTVAVSASSPAPNQLAVTFGTVTPPGGETTAGCSITTSASGTTNGGCTQITNTGVPEGALTGQACARFDPSGRTACADFSVTVTAPAPTGFFETTGGVTHTWTNYTNAGGTEGPTIPAFTTVQIACRLTGWTAPNGNNWWYRIAQAPWSGTYHASADAFYNNGATSGSLVGTPYVDPAVPMC